MTSTRVAPAPATFFTHASDEFIIFEYSGVLPY
jgi:hypothetical protein